MGVNGIPALAGIAEVVGQIVVGNNIFSGGGAFHRQVGIIAGKRQVPADFSAVGGDPAGQIFLDFVAQFLGRLGDRFFEFGAGQIQVVREFLVALEIFWEVFLTESKSLEVRLPSDSILA